MMRDLDDVLFRDVGGKIAADGRYKLNTVVYLDYFVKQYSRNTRNPPPGSSFGGPGWDQPVGPTFRSLNN